MIEREIVKTIRLTPEEWSMIQRKMAQLGTTNFSAYIRKMAIDGYAVRLELPELKEMVSLLRYSSNNLNQLTRRVHETGRIYDAVWRIFARDTNACGMRHGTFLQPLQS